LEVRAACRRSWDIREEISDVGSAVPGASAELSIFGADATAGVRNGRKSSIGIGKIVVELFSAAISVTVCR
jgi:hypothetical protein